MEREKQSEKKQEDKKEVGLCFGKIQATSENEVCKSRQVAFIEDLVMLPECRDIATALMDLPSYIRWEVVRMKFDFMDLMA